MVTFIERNKRNPTRYDMEERGRCGNSIKHNKKLYMAGEMKEVRIAPFKSLLDIREQYRRKNQYR